MLGFFLLGIAYGKVWPSYSDHYEFNLDTGVYFLSWMGQGDEAVTSPAAAQPLACPKKRGWGLRTHPALAVNKSNSHIVGCMVSASKCKC